jgi:hypothetical protein
LFPKEFREFTGDYPGLAWISKAPHKWARQAVILYLFLAIGFLGTAHAAGLSPAIPPAGEGFQLAISGPWGMEAEWRCLTMLKSIFVRNLAEHKEGQHSPGDARAGRSLIPDISAENDVGSRTERNWLRNGRPRHPLMRGRVVAISENFIVPKLQIESWRLPKVFNGNRYSIAAEASLRDVNVSAQLTLAALPAVVNLNEREEREQRGRYSRDDLQHATPRDLLGGFLVGIGIGGIILGMMRGK